jgi:hypothetical protein
LFQNLSHLQNFQPLIINVRVGLGLEIEVRVKVKVRVRVTAEDIFLFLTIYLPNFSDFLVFPAPKTNVFSRGLV